MSTQRRNDLGSWVRTMGVTLVTVVVLGSCSSNSATEFDIDSVVASLGATADRTHTSGNDIWEVAVCRIPEHHDIDLYDMSGVRFTQSSEWIVERLAPVSDYFDRWSGGHYAVEFRSAVADAVPKFGGARECVDSALAHSSADVDGVLVVADAQHDESRGGGFARTEGLCMSSCDDRAKRVIYIGAADFVGKEPIALDLVEHELGHALGWPHSRRSVDYDSGLDVMSDSAAGRRFDPNRDHAPGVIAINRYLAGWMNGPPTVIDSRVSSTFDIGLGDIALVPMSPTSVIAVEVIRNAGEYDHLPHAGIAFHLIEWGSEVCPNPVALPGVSAEVCAGTARSHRSIAPAASENGVMETGDRVDFEGVVISVVAIDDRNGDLTASVHLSTK